MRIFAKSLLPLYSAVGIPSIRRCALARGRYTWHVAIAMACGLWCAERNTVLSLVSTHMHEALGFMLAVTGILTLYTQTSQYYF